MNIYDQFSTDEDTIFKNDFDIETASIEYQQGGSKVGTGYRELRNMYGMSGTDDIDDIINGIDDNSDEESSDVSYIR